MSVLQASSIRTGSIFSNLDADGDGFVDNSDYYQLLRDGNPIDLTNSAGRTFSDNSSRVWNAIKAIDSGSGFQVLLEGSSRLDGRFRVWDVSSSGVISSSSRWLSTSQALQEGWESLFGDVIQPDGTIGAPPFNNGEAEFEIIGTPEINQTLRADLSADDPDGNGDFDYIWQSSNNLRNWNNIGFNQNLTVDSSLSGRNVRAMITYTDGEGFGESVTTESVLVPVQELDDYGSTPGQSGSLSVGTSLQGELETQGDRDWFAITLESDTNYVFELTGITLGDPLLALRDSGGTIITSDDDGGEGLNSRLSYSNENAGIYYLDAGSYPYADQTIGRYEIQATEVLPPPPGFNSEDGYGHINASKAFETLLGISLNDTPDLGGNLWGLDNINAPEVWNGGDSFSGVTGYGSTVAVIDTGVDLDHPEFQGRITNGYDFVDNDNNADDGNGHGTHVAGTIGGANDGRGITGVAPDASIMPIRVLGNDGYGYTSDIIAGVYWATDNGADVINLSLGGGGYSQAMADAIAYASNNGSVVVMAAGNSGGQSPDYPAAHAVDHGIAVGAVNQQKTMAGFSNRAGTTTLDYVTAPGVNIYSSVPGGGYSSFSGTSMATPHVAGLAGLLKSYDDSMSAESIENLIIESAYNSESEGNTSNNLDTITGQSSNQFITLESFVNSEELPLSSRLIGSIRGDAKARKSTIKELKTEMMHGELIETLEVVASTQKKFVTLELGDLYQKDHAVFIENLLTNNQFNYFEVDTQMTIF
jgi:subtilisin family serine protease